MFKRWLSLPRSKSFILFGPRRAGKTTLLKEQLRTFAYITFDDYDALSVARHDPKQLIEGVEQNGIIFDEVQRVPEFLISVKFAIDELKKNIAMTGSSSLGLLSHGTETLAGRIQILECPTFCWGEERGAATHRILTMPKDPRQIREANRQLDLAIHFGGFPEVIAAPDESTKTEILRNYRNTYFTRDLLLLSNIENADGLLALLNYLGISLGSHTEKTNICRESGLSHPTVSKYLNVIRDSRLALTLYGYQHGPAKRLIKAAKTYFTDNGILTALNAPVSIGQRLENFVVSEFEKRRVLGAIPADRMYYYKSAGGAEIDLIIEETATTRGTGLVHAIEIKNTAKPSRRDIATVSEFVRESPKKRRGYLLYRGDKAYELDGVQVLPIAHLYRAF